jgi:peptidoglycan-N-acetylglucosamine deacetylase
MSRLALLVFAFLSCALPCIAADFRWPGHQTSHPKKCAIVLTYEDGLRSQLDVALPQLDAAGFHGTFFLDSAVTPSTMRRWRVAAQAGHELGNKALFSPCPRAILPGRRNYTAEDYDTERILTEIGVMNSVLFGIDGREIRTYSAPCGQTLVGGVDYTDALRASHLVKYARIGGDSSSSIVTDFSRLDVFRVPSYAPMDKPDGAALIAYAERVRAARGLGVLQFHGVGGDYLEVSAEAHRQLLAWLRKQPDVWVAPFQEVMDYVNAQ